MKKKGIKRISLRMLIILIIVLICYVVFICYTFEVPARIEKWITEKYVENIEYDIKVQWHPRTMTGGYATTKYYTLINTDAKIAYKIKNYYVYGVEFTFKKGNNYTIDKIKLSDEQIEKLNEYKTKESDSIGDGSISAYVFSSSSYYTITFDDGTIKTFKSFSLDT